MVTTMVDLKHELKHVYSADPLAPSIVDVPELGFLSIDGSGDPNTSTDYRNAIEALYSVAYTLKFTIKRRLDGLDFTVMPLEGLWWADDMSSFVSGDRSRWQWKALIAQPDRVTAELVEEAALAAAAKKTLPALPKLRFEQIHEGLAAQVLHVGPYSDEQSTIELLHEFIAEHGFRLSGRHHEIYLSDPRRSAPEKNRTIVRQPIV